MQGSHCAYERLAYMRFLAPTVSKQTPALGDSLNKVIKFWNKTKTSSGCIITDFQARLKLVI